MGKLRYYISGHGLGHASRSGQIINALRRRHPAIAVEVVSAAAPWFLAGFLDPAVPVRRRQLDVGVVQQDSLLMQKEQTLRACLDFLRQQERLIAEEAESLRRGGVSLVAADIPWVPFVAARRAGIPGVGISNFSWDWIYRGFAGRHPGFAAVADAAAAGYRQADLLLRLPLHGDFPAFGRVEDLPLVARRAARPRRQVRALLGLAETGRVALISFGGFGLGAFDFSRLGQLAGWTFLTEAALAARAPNVLTVAPGAVSYPELVAAADVVVTKPGYGIVAEAIAAGAAVLYTSRGDFREESVLVAALHRYARARQIDGERLRRGEWGEELAALLARPAPAEHLPLDGDEVAADRLAELAQAGFQGRRPRPEKK